MEVTTELPVAVPEGLVEEFLKRVPFVSEGISNIRLLSGAKFVAFELRSGFEARSDLVASHISDIASTLCLNSRPEASRIVAKRSIPVGPFRADPHPLLL